MRRIYLIIILILLLSNIIYAHELNCPKYYECNEENTCIFTPISKADYKKLSKNDKEEYKKISKAAKYIQKGLTYSQNKWLNGDKYFFQAIKYDKESEDVAWVNLLHYYYNISDYTKLTQYAEYVLTNISQKYNDFPNLYVLTASAYLNLSSFQSAYKYADKYIKMDKSRYKTNPSYEEFAYYIMAYSIINLGLINEYNAAVKYTEKYANSNNPVLKYHAHDVRCLIFLHQNKREKAIAEAKLLIEIKNKYNLSYNPYIRLAECQTNINDKLDNYKKAYENSLNLQEQIEIAKMIAKLEQSKIDDSVKNLNIYVKTPNWEELAKKISEYLSLEFVLYTQQLFFDKTNYCLKNYYGSNLAACYEQINRENDDLVYNLRDIEFKQQVLANQEKIIRQQAENNARVNEYLRNTYIRSMQPQTYQVTPIGNTLYIKKY